MKKYLILLSASLFLQIALSAASSTTSVITMSVAPINELAISGTASTLAVTSATAGNALIAANSSGMTYAITTNQTNKKITASLDSDMPTGTFLELTLNAPSGATSAGSKVLSTIDSTLVTGISTLAESGRAMHLSFGAEPIAGVIPSFNRTLTLTLVDGT